MECQLPSDIARLSVSAATHKGYARSGNEDSFLVDHHIGGGDLDQLTVELMVASNAVVLAIADGLGGHKAGEVASRYAVEQISAVRGEAGHAELPAYGLGEQLRHLPGGGSVVPDPL